MSLGAAYTASGRQVDRRAWLLLSMLMVVTASAKFFTPQFIGNEDVYLIRGQQIVDDSYLRGDWAWSYQSGDSSLRIPFDPLVAALASVADEPLKLALLTRVLLWIAIALAMAAALLALGLRPVAIAVGWMIWFFNDQSLMAGEWIFGGAESKVAAYALLFIGITLAARERWLASGVALGLAVWMHVLVGFWGGCLIGLAALYTAARNKSAQEVVKYSAGAALVGGGAVLYAFLSVFSGRDAGGATPDLVLENASELFVRFRNPHHLDPAVFTTVGDLLLVGVSLAFLALAWRKGALGAARMNLFGPILAGSVVLFLSAVVLRSANLWEGLVVYPFRVPDTLLPLLLLCLLSHVAVRWVDQHASRVKTVLPMTLGLVWSVWAIASLGLSGKASLGTLLQAQDQRSALEQWVHTQTEPDDVFLVNPCLPNVYQTLRRPIVVTFKAAPVAKQQFSEWLQRLFAASGKENPMQQQGFAACELITRGFRQLSANDLQQISAQYSASYYVVDRERDLPDTRLRYRDQRWSVYQLIAD